jgi:hypothetical protein
MFPPGEGSTLGPARYLLAMPAIAVRELLALERVASGAAIIEMLLSERPSRHWVKRFEAHSDVPPDGIVYDVKVDRDRPSVTLRTLPPLDEERERRALEWLHEIVATTNADDI